MKDKLWVCMFLVTLVAVLISCALAQTFVLPENKEGLPIQAWANREVLPVQQWINRATVTAPQLNQTPLQPHICYTYITMIPETQTETLQDTYLYPTILGEIRDYDLNILLRTNFGFDTCMSFVTDAKYALTSLEQAQNFTAGDKKYPFSIEGHDCDNFAAQLWGYWSQGDTSFAFGWAKSGTHAFNFMVDDKLNIYIVEPVTNEFIPFQQVLASDNSTYMPLMYVI